jgi:hypothetical protein
MVGTCIFLHVFRESMGNGTEVTMMVIMQYIKVFYVAKAINQPKKNAMLLPR